MTRRHAERPVWEWACDKCGRVSGDLAYDQGGLPSADDMRARGWFIAKVWGDLCSDCKDTP